MGRVYLGYDPFRDRSVALKIARRDLLPENRGDELFFNEMRTAGLLNHPNIVQIYDAGTEGNDYYIAMEYVAGSHTLERHCQRDGLLPLETAAEIVFKCAEALGLCASQGGHSPRHQTRERAAGSRRDGQSRRLQRRGAGRPSCH